MATKKKLLEAAAGAAGGGAALNVEDVFSTYLYTGNDDKQGIPNGIALADGVGGGTSTEFDGVSDFLSRSSDLTGNADGKTFTLSCWVYRTGAVPLRAVYPFRYQGYFYLEVGKNGAINVGGANTSGSTILEATLPSKTVPLKVWTHILVSVDLSNTSNRHIYLNDVAASPTWVTYSNQDIDFTRTTSHINSNSVGSFGSARHAHIYLDYTYRDLSVTSNRRYFIDANGGSTSPSTLSALNPIVYLPMTSAYSIGENLGTGGDYTVNGSPKVVQSGTEYLSDYGKGGLVWLKSRGFTNTNTNLTGSHALIDTERGNTSRLLSNTTDAAQSDGSNYVNSFNSDGFTVGTTMSNGFDGGHRYASWTFRKAPKFFDVVQFSGNSSGVTVNHNLGSDVGFIVVKRTDSTSSWTCWHRNDGTSPLRFSLESTLAGFSAGGKWGTVDSSSFSMVSGATDTGATYVAYLFAHNNGDGDFGSTADQDIIKCGNYTGGGTTNVSIDLGFEPQWVMIKAAAGTTGDWAMFDNMRGIVTGGTDNLLRANATNAEYTLVDYIDVTSTGFKTIANNNYTNGSGSTYIYIAIRRGPMAVPESATEVFDVNTYANNGNSNIYNTGFNADMNINKNATSSDGFYVIDRLRGAPFLLTNSTVAETGGTGTFWNSGNNLLDLKSSWWSTTSGVVSWSWKRAPSFMDVVAYTGSSSAQNINHNLGVAPEMIWVKRRTGATDWGCYHKDTGTSKYLSLNQTYAAVSYSLFTATSDTTFSVIGNDNYVNASGSTYIAYLFASLDGVSKVGSYTGTGTTQNIDCGFSNGARFVLIKNASTGSSDWFVWDSVRGITSGDDPYLRLNLPNAEQTFSLSDIEPTPSSNGFQVNGSYFTINASGDTYIFYAIA